MFQKMADSEFIVALTLINVGAFYSIERLMSFAMMVYQWYFKAVTRDRKTTRYDAERNVSEPPVFGGENIEP
jgi:hypothetical protein